MFGQQRPGFRGSGGIPPGVLRHRCQRGTLRLQCERHGRAMAAWQPAKFECGRTVCPSRRRTGISDRCRQGQHFAGCRDMKVAAFVRRPLGEPATVAEWESRELPARTMFAALEPMEAFQKRLRPQAARLHALGNGAEWIWNAVDSNFPRCRQTLDIYHGNENVAQASKGLYGEERRRRGGASSVVAASCWPTAGPGSATLWRRSSRWRTPPSDAKCWRT